MREGLLRKAINWTEARWDGVASLRTFLGKPVPANVSWLHTLGSLLIVYLVFQAVTGVLLAFYYSPSPENAYKSVRYIQEELTFGRLIHALHRCGASFILVTAFLHFLRSYFMASWRSPRELVWITGLVLGILLTLFAFTGALLPYDQKGYWATVVGINIASGAPGAGDVVKDLLTGGFGGLGSVTLSRFFILHVSVLPLIFAAAVVMHLKTLQKVGSAGPLSGVPGDRQPFFPRQAFKDVVMAGIGSLALVLVSLLVTFTETGPASSQAGSFVPRPEWYFMGHYELLRLLPPGLQMIGTFVLPNALLGLLFALPFISRGPDRRFSARKMSTILGAAAVTLLVALTVMGMASVEEAPQDGEAMIDTGDPLGGGRELFHRKECSNCHRIAGQGGTDGPDLSHVGNRLRPDYLESWIRNPRLISSKTLMPAFEGSEPELRSVVTYLLSLK